VDCGFSAAGVLTECTVAHNTSNGVSTAFGGTMTLSNSIVWGHTGVEIVPGEFAAYCDVEGGYPGIGNFSAYPLFVDTNALDYRLDFLSPCVDTGTTVFLTYDAIGTPRPLGAGYDLGAFEQNPAPVQVVWPNLLYFGELVPGESTNLDAYVGNLGYTTLLGSVDNLLAPVFSMDGLPPYVVEPLDTGTVTLTFAPITDGITWTNFVEFAGNGGTNGMMLVGTGIPEPAAALAAVILLALLRRRMR
jgi:hypothetical protein